MKTGTFILSALALAILCAAVAADTIELTNGRKLEGKVVKENDSEIVIEMKGLGQVTVPRRQVKKITKDEKEGPKLPEGQEKKTPAKPVPDKPEEDQDKSGETSKRRPLNSTEIKAVVEPITAYVDGSGSHVVAELQVESGSILEIMSKRSAFPTFKDDKGNILGKKEENEDGGTAGIMSSDSIDGKRMRYKLDMRAQKSPPRNVSALTVRGRVPLCHATKTRTDTVKDIELKPGTKFSLYDIKMTIVSARQVEDTETKEKHFHVEVTFSPDEPFVLGCIDELSFTDTEGNALEWGEGKGSMTQSGSGPAIYAVTWVFRRKADKVNVNYRIWTDAKYRHVDINVTATIETWKD